MRLSRRNESESSEQLHAMQQQLSAAIAEYEGRQRYLKQLLGDAEAVLADLEEQARAERAAAAAEGEQSRDTGESDAATRQRAAELDRLIAEQTEQIDLIRSRYAEVVARVAEMTCQRDLLTARGIAVDSQSALPDESRGGRLRRRKIWLAASACAVLLVIGGLVALSLSRSPEWHGAGAPPSKSYGSDDPGQIATSGESGNVPDAKNGIADANSTSPPEPDAERNPLDAPPPARDPKNLWPQTAANRRLKFAPGIVTDLSYSVTALDFKRGWSRDPNLGFLAGEAGGGVRCFTAYNGIPQLYGGIFAYPQRINQVTFSGREGQAACAVDDGTIAVIDPFIYVRIAILDGHTQPARSIQFSADGTRLLSASTDGTLRLWNIAQAREIARINLDPSRADVRRISWSEATDRVLVASALERDSLALYRLNSGEELQVFETERYPTDEACLFDGGRQALSTGRREIHVWDTAQSKSVRRFGGGFKVAAFTPDGLRAITGNSDYSVTVWDVETGEPVQQSFGHTGPITSVAIADDGRMGLSAAEDRTLRLWQLPGLAGLRETLEVHDAGVQTIAFVAEAKNPPGTIPAVSAGLDGKVVSIALGRLGYNPFNSASSELAFPATIRYPPPTSAKTSHTVAPPIALIRLSSDGSRMLYEPAGSADSPATARIMAVHYTSGAGPPRKDEEHPYRDLQEAASAAAFSPNGTLIAGGTAAGQLWIQDLATEREIARLDGGVAIAAIAFPPDGRPWVLWGGDDNEVHLWNYQTQQELRRFTGHTGFIRSVQFVPDGKHAISASADFTIRIWDVDTGATRHVLSGHRDPVNAVAVSPDGNLVLSGSDDKTVRKWDAATGKLLFTFRSHTLPVRCLAISPDSSFCLSGSDDKTIRVWDLH